MHVTRIILAALLLAPGLARGQLSQPPAGNQPFVASGGGAARSAAVRATDIIQAVDYGSCTWDAAHDVGACINAAIAKAAALGGRTVEIPAGTYGVSTPIVQNTSGVHLVGAGGGIPRDSMIPGAYQAVTRLVWTGSAGTGSTVMLDVEPASTSVPSLYSADVRGIAFDCASLCDISVKIAQVNHSMFDFGVAEPRSIGAYLTTTTTADAPGTQSNDITINARSTSATYAPTGILIDGGAGSSWNVSYNHIHRLYAWYAKGDGIVFGNSDNNVIEELSTYPQPGATGSQVVFATPGYVMPNGLTVTGSPYTTRVLHIGTPITVQGYSSGLAITQGTHTGTATVGAAVSLTTNASTAAGSGVLTFASTTGVVAGEMARCGVPSVIPNDIQVLSTTGTTVTLAYPAISTVPSGTTCTFGRGANASAVTGTYTLAATGASTYNLTAPAGGNSQTGIVASGGALAFSDLILPVTGSAANGDTWSIVVPGTPTNVTLENIDKANNVPSPHFNPGASGTFQTSTNPYPVQANPLSGISFAFAPEQCSGKVAAAGSNAVNLGNCGGIGATGSYSTTINGVGNVASGFGAITIGGHNLQVTGSYSGAFGENNTVYGYESFALGESLLSSGDGSLVAGEYATDRATRGRLVFGAQAWRSQGGAQIAWQPLGRRTTSTTAVILTADNNAPSSGLPNVAILAPNSAYLVKSASVVIRDTTTGNVCSFVLSPLTPALVRQGANAASTASVGTLPTFTAGPATGLTCTAPTLVVDATIGAIEISATPPNANQIDIVGLLETVEVQ